MVLVQNKKLMYFLKYIWDPLIELYGKKKDYLELFMAAY